MKKHLKKWMLLGFVMLLTLSCFSACGSSGKDNDAAAKYPERTIEFIVPYAAGGGTDIMARSVAAALSKNEGWTCTVTNIEGASAAIGSMEAYNREPDGYTILVHQIEAMMAYYLGGVYDVALHDEMEPIASVVYDANCISVPAKSEFKTMDDIIKYAKKNPGKLTWASTGAKSSNEQGSAEIWKEADIKVNYIPYDSASKSRTAVLGGHADVLYSQVSEVKALVDSGEMRIIATSEEEQGLFKDVPTMKSAGYDIVNGLHRGFFVPKETPEGIVTKVEAAMKKVCEEKDFIKTMETDLGYSVDFVGGADLKAYAKERFPVQEELWNLIKE